LENSAKFTEEVELLLSCETEILFLCFRKEEEEEEGAVALVVLENSFNSDEDFYFHPSQLKITRINT